MNHSEGSYSNMFDKGSRVITPGGPGEVVYMRMKAPDYSEPYVYSVRLDSRKNTIGYNGTVYMAEQVSEAVS